MKFHCATYAVSPARVKAPAATRCSDLDCERSTESAHCHRNEGRRTHPGEINSTDDSLKPTAEGRPLASSRVPGADALASEGSCLAERPSDDDRTVEARSLANDVDRGVPSRVACESGISQYSPAFDSLERTHPEAQDSNHSPPAWRDRTSKVPGVPQRSRSFLQSKAYP